MSHMYYQGTADGYLLIEKIQAILKTSNGGSPRQYRVNSKWLMMRFITPGNGVALA